MAHKGIPILLCGIGLLICLSPLPPRAFALDSGEFARLAVPAGAITLPTLRHEDLDEDDMEESLVLAGGVLSIHSANGVDWQSPPSWQVQQAAMSDLDQDGHTEVTLLLWRPFRPWPVDAWLPNGGRIETFHNEEGQSCHIILIGWRQGSFRELWAGSALAEPVTSFASADLDGDGDQELITLESTYAAARSAPAQKLKAWEWNGFGFTIVSSLEGSFSNLVLIHSTNDQILILVP